MCNSRMGEKMPGETDYSGWVCIVKILLTMRKGSIRSPTRGVATPPPFRNHFVSSRQDPFQTFLFCVSAFVCPDLVWAKMIGVFEEVPVLEAASSYVYLQLWPIWRLGIRGDDFEESFAVNATFEPEHQCMVACASGKKKKKKVCRPRGSDCASPRRLQVDKSPVQGRFDDVYIFGSSGIAMSH